MKLIFQPEGMLIGTQENREAVSSLGTLERAWANGTIVEGMATFCDSDLRLHVDLGGFHGIMEPDDAVLCRGGETRKDIAIITRVGKPVAARIVSIERQNGAPLIRLSRRAAQRDCLDELVRTLRPGDLIPAKVTHLEPFGAFLDIGCGIASLLSVDCISVSRISHPRDRLAVGNLLTVAVKNVEPESGRVYATLRELLGTWSENAAQFEQGQTVTGVIRSVENYGIFVELTPNLAGLAELRGEDSAERMRTMIGKGAAVYIKSIIPDRMKIKLVLIDAGFPPPRRPLDYYVDVQSVRHLSAWTYSPVGAGKLVETRFDEPS